MSELTLRAWRQIDANKVWEQGLPLNLFRNKTYLKKMISQYKKFRQAEVFLIFSQNNQVFAMLFLESNFLDPRTITGNILPLSENYNINSFSDKTLFKIGLALNNKKLKFDQLILQIPNQDKTVTPGTEDAFYLGDSIYPNHFETKVFAASDFDLVNYIIVPFRKHQIVVYVKKNTIIQVEFIQPNQQIYDLSFKKALAKQKLLADSGYMIDSMDVTSIISNIDPIDPELQAKIIEQFTAYFSGKLKTFELPYEIQTGTQFQREVWEILSNIPYGVVYSYKEVAERLQGKSDKAHAYSRAVGAACGQNPIGIIIPCHRVIGKDRSLTGFGGGVKLKGHLLDLEFMGRASK